MAEKDKAPELKPTVTVTKAEEVAPVEVVVQPKTVKVTPRKSITSVRIGPKYYSFKAGVTIEIPADMRDHLVEKDII